MAELVFLKLGGSLITDKTRPYTARLDKLADLTRQIAAVLSSTPDLRLVLGHGSGSFGHTAAKEYGTREGIVRPSPAALPPLRSGIPLRAHVLRDLPKGEGVYWRGFAEAHFRAAQLNHFVMQALYEAGIAALAFPPSTSVTANEGRISEWDIEPIRTALENGILPVVFGDVAFDETRGGTILSTEDLFEYLARQFSPARILLAGLEAGVWADFPGRTRLLNEISPRSYETMRAGLGSAVGVDVTGGMESKVKQMLGLAQELGLKAQIFSGDEPGKLKQALGNAPIGTTITA